MKATEHEMTVAVEAAAKQHYATTVPEDLQRPWEEVDPMFKHRIKDVLLPLVLVVLEALPDRRAAAWEEGFSAGWNDHQDDDPRTAMGTPNPYSDGL